MEQGQEQQLWDAFRQGDRQAFEELFLMFNNTLFAVGLKLTDDKALAEDYIHEVFIDLWHKRNALKAVDNVKYYLVVCYRRLLVGHLSADSKKTNLYTEVSEPQVDSAEYKLIEEQLKKDTISKLKEAIDKLPERQKQIIELRYMKSMGYDEIENIMSINYTSSRKLVYKAITNLKKHLGTDLLGIILLLFYL
jgi:RNA polymerase sigma-70 factor (ECF subfamily)